MAHHSGPARRLGRGWTPPAALSAVSDCAPTSDVAPLHHTCRPVPPNKHQPVPPNRHQPVPPNRHQPVPPNKHQPVPLRGRWPAPLDSGFASGQLSPGDVSPGVLSPQPKPSPPLFPRPRGRPSDAGGERRGGEPVSLSLAERKLSDQEARIQCEHRYLGTLDEAFRGDDDGDTDLHLAIICGQTHVAECLVRLAFHPEFLNLRNRYLQSPLHLAALTGQADLCRYLLVAGADASQRDRHGSTPLHVACQRVDLACVHALTVPVSVLESRALPLRYVCPPPAPAPLEQWDYQGLSCLHLATVTGDVRLVAHLVSHGADVAGAEGKSGRTPLHLAAEAGDMPMLHLLVVACHADLDALTYSGLSSYQLALRNARLDVAELLSTLGAACDELPESDQDMSDSDSEIFVKSEKFYSDVRLGVQPLETAP